MARILTALHTKGMNKIRLKLHAKNLPWKKVLGKMDAIPKYPDREQILSTLKSIEEEIEDDRLITLREKVIAWKGNGTLLPEIANFLMNLYIAHRNKEVFFLLYRLNYKRLAHIAWRTVRNREDLRDIIQEVFLRIHKYARNFRDEEPSSFEKWSNSIARNASLQLLEEKKRKAKLMACCLRQAQGTGKEAFQLGVKEKEPPQILMRREEQDLYGILFHYTNRFLTESEKNILFLIDSQKWSYKEVSDVLGIPKSQIGTYAARARARRVKLMVKRLKEMKHEKKAGTFKTLCAQPELPGTQLTKQRRNIPLESAKRKEEA